MRKAHATDQVSMLHLRYFLAVHDAGTVGAAAETLRISQPSLSQQILTLERRLGARLFDRSPSGMTATDAGRQLAAVATQALRGVDSLGPTPSIRHVAVPRGIDSSVLDLLVSRLGDDVRFTPLDTSKAVRALGREVDAAVLRGPVPDAGAGVRVSVLREAPLGVLLASDHLLAERGRLTWEDLRDRELLWFDERRAPHYAEWLLGECRAHGWEPRLRQLDPASAQLTEDALRRDHRLVSLRPEPARPPNGVAWVALADAPMEQLVLAARE